MEAKQTFKVIVAGGRDFGDYGLLCQTCDRMLSQKHQTHDIVIISGTARGSLLIGNMPESLQALSGIARWLT